jgi:hypothetical protein
VADLDYARLQRVLTRSQELGEPADAHANLKLAWNDLLKAPATVYLAAYDKLIAAESAANKEGAEARKALAQFDQPYAAARAMVRGYLPNEVLPDTLKSLPTDTDRKNAIIHLRNVLEAQGDATPWAKAQLDGTFGANAADVIREVSEWIDANGDVADAVTARATAYGPAYEKYLAFKNIVRTTHGPSSHEYRRIHIRAGADDTAAATDPSAGGAATGASGATGAASPAASASKSAT